MISFQKFRQYGRFGNQLFQYAFLRATARRLGVRFYCPAWLGDDIFTLNDRDERAPAPEGITRRYIQPKDNCGFDPQARFIKDHTDVLGYFQSPRHFDPAAAREWYTFRDDAVAAVRDKYRGLDFARCVGVHFRFGDMVNNPFYINPAPDYYRKALARTRPYQQVLLFSDDIPAAEERMRQVGVPFMSMRDNKGFEDLFLLTQCRAVVCSVSTFSWWGGWLNARPDKKVAAPLEWIRPGQRIHNDGLICPDWINLRAAHLQDDYRFIIAKKVWGERLARARSRDFLENLHTLQKFILRKGRAVVQRGSAMSGQDHKGVAP